MSATGRPLPDGGPASPEAAAELGRFGEDIRRRLTAEIVAGADVAEIVELTSREIGAPVFLEKHGAGLVLSAGDSREETLCRSEWYAFERDLPSAPPALVAEVPGADRRWGRVVAFPGPETDEERTRVALEQVAGLIGLVVLHDRDEGRLRSRDQFDFLAGLMDGGGSEEEHARRASRYGWVEGRKILPVGVSIEADGTGPGQLERTWSALEAALRGSRLEIISGSDRTRRVLLLLVALRDADHRDWAGELIVEEAGRAAERYCGDDAAVRVCVAAADDDFTSAAAGLQKVREGVRIKERTREPAPAAGWFDVSGEDLDQFVWSLREQPQVLRFARQRLASLVRYDADGRLELVATLGAYCDSGGQKTAAAAKLCIERQSLYHRLAKIESLLGVDLSDGRTVTELALALEIRKVLGQS